MPKVKKQKHIPDRVDALWGLVCSMSSVDHKRNNISLFNVIDQLSIPKSIIESAETLPLSINVEHELVIVWRRVMPHYLCTNALRLDVKISNIDPAGKVLSEILTQIDFSPKLKIIRMQVQNQFFHITNEGDYIYRIEAVQNGTTDFEQMLDIPYFVQFI
jgi:hypothetical protein